MTAPKVSIVMGVYNNAQTLPQCVQQLVNQSFKDFELLIFDDASSDASASIIGEFAQKDKRIKFTKNAKNRGLTQNLVDGCKMARGQYIARQDADDYSALNRLEQQVNLLDSHQDIVVVATSFCLLGPRDEVLVPLIKDDVESMNAIWQQAQSEGVNPHHGSTLFRKSTYEQVGGYRSAFRVAQDCDLWWRMMECGRFYSIEETLYFSRYHIGSITAKAHRLQRDLSRYALEATKLRRSGKNERDLIAQIAQYSTQNYKGVDAEEGIAESNYFVAACLNKQSNAAALTYAKEALKYKPLSPSYILQFLRALVNKLRAVV